MAERLEANVTQTGANQRDLVKVLQNLRDVVNELQTDHDTLVSALTGNYCLSTPGLAIGSTNTAVASLAFSFGIGGVIYNKAADAVGVAPGDDVIATGKYGAVAFDIGADGTIDAIEATGQAAAEFATEAEAIAALPDPATGHARLGYVTATKSDGAFTFGTTALNAVNSTVAYTNSPTMFESGPAALTNSTPITLNKG